MNITRQARGQKKKKRLSEIKRRRCRKKGRNGKKNEK